MLDISSYQKFIRAAALEYKNHPSHMGQIVAELLSKCEISKITINQQDTFNSGKNFRIDSHSLLSTIIQSNSHSLLKDLNHCYETLAWRPSGFGRLPPEITNHVAVTEIVGPDGMFSHQDFRFGLLLQDPSVIYAKHQHAAEELYCILNGVASWSVDDEIAIEHSEGEFIHHAENQPHQMITNDESLLAMWAWIGDIGAASYSI